MDQDALESRAAGAKGYSSVIDVTIGQEAALWVMSFACMVMMAVRVDVWGPYVADALVWMGV